MSQYAIVKYHELALKGKNRPMYIKQLVDNLRSATRGTGVEHVWKGQAMIGLTLSDEAEWPQVRDRIGDCSGVAKFFLAQKLAPELGAVKRLLRSTVPEMEFGSFRITANRADKRFPITSHEINCDLGTYVQSLVDVPVKLKGADLNVHVDVLPREILVYFEEQKGFGGLPVGVSGTVAGLLSGGIDSPVAAWQMMKRGCDVKFIHFHSYPMVDTSSIDKAIELVEELTRFQYRSTLYLVPFSEAQREIIVSVPAKSRVVLYRRFMMRIAERIAMETGAHALLTGESLGQVASQTLENIATIEDSTDLPILRPLIGSNKQEIIDVAKKIGTYQISIQPDQDCCSLFVPKHPETKSTPARARRLEELLPVDAMVETALEGVEIRKFAFP